MAIPYKHNSPRRSQAGAPSSEIFTLDIIWSSPYHPTLALSGRFRLPGHAFDKQRNSRRLTIETYIPTKSNQTQTHAWIFNTYENPRRPSGAQAPSCPGTQTPDRLIRDALKLSRIGRLRKSAEYKDVYDKGRRFSDPLFNVFILGDDSRDVRFGITVTRRIGNAVMRNRIRRVIRESVRHLRPLCIAGGDCIIHVRSAEAGESERITRQHLERLWQRAGWLPVDSSVRSS